MSTLKAIRYNNYNDITSIVCISRSQIYIITAVTRLWYSSDYGFSFNQVLAIPLSNTMANLVYNSWAGIIAFTVIGTSAQNGIYTMPVGGSPQLIPATAGISFISLVSCPASSRLVAITPADTHLLVYTATNYTWVRYTANNNAGHNYYLVATDDTTVVTASSSNGGTINKISIPQLTAGNSWTNIGSVDTLAALAIYGNNIFLLFDDTFSIRRSTNGGTNFSSVSPAKAWEAIVFSSNGNNILLYESTTNNVWASSDLGNTFTTYSFNNTISNRFNWLEVIYNSFFLIQILIGSNMT